MSFRDPRLEPVKGYSDCIFCGHRVAENRATTIQHPAIPDFKAHTACVQDRTFEQIKAAAMSAMHDVALGRRLAIPVYAPGLGAGTPC
jgi:hypothetical protein